MCPDPRPPHGGAERRSPFRRAGRAIRRVRAGNRWTLIRAVGIWERSLAFAALGFLTLVPLLIVVSAANPASGRGFAQWLGDGLGVSAAAQGDIEHLFARPDRAWHATTAFGLAVLAVFGVSFATVVQSGYERIWSLPPDHWWARWRHVVWLAALTGLLLLSANSPVWRDSPARGAVTTVAGTLFFWWSQRMLLGGRVAWGDLLPGAVATMVGLTGLRWFSRLVFSPLIASGTVAYGAFGTVLVIQSWLVGVGVVVFGGALAGPLLHDDLARVARALRRHA